MPTARPRYQITETPELERALDLAAQRWPDESRAKLLVRLVHAGSAALEDEGSERTRRRCQAVADTSGKYGEAFPETYLSDLRRDWPE